MLDAGDSVTAVGISHVLTPDGRYCWFSDCHFVSCLTELSTVISNEMNVIILLIDTLLQ